jgi:hypothetical protein
MCCIYFLASAAVASVFCTTEYVAESAAGEKQHQNQEEEQKAAVNAAYVIGNHMEYLLKY